MRGSGECIDASLSMTLIPITGNATDLVALSLLLLFPKKAAEEAADAVLHALRGRGDSIADHSADIGYKDWVLRRAFNAKRNWLVHLSEAGDLLQPSHQVSAVVELRGHAEGQSIGIRH